MVNGASKTVRELLPGYEPWLGGMITPFVGNSPQSMVDLGLPWVADNGCFTGFDEAKFLRMLDRIAGLPRLQWVTAPDVVSDHDQTLARFHVWQPRLTERGLPVAFVAQDGCRELPALPFDCLFLGGSTDWKLGEEAERLCRLAKLAGKLVHMGRVNSVRRLRHAYRMGCDSVDGTGTSMFPMVKIPLYVEALKELLLERPLFQEVIG